MAIIYFDEEGQQDEAMQINAVAKSKDKLGTFACFRATHVSIFMCMREENHFPHHYRVNVPVFIMSSSFCLVESLLSSFSFLLTS